MSIKFLSAILGPEMAAPILWTPGKKKASVLQEKPMSIKFLVLGGGWGGGGKCQFYFYGREDFSDEWGSKIASVLGTAEGQGT